MNNNNDYNEGIISIDIAVPVDVRVREQETEKVEMFMELKRDFCRLWKFKHVEVVRVVIVTIGGSVTKEFERWIEKLGIAYNSGVM